MQYNMPIKESAAFILMTMTLFPEPGKIPFYKNSFSDASADTSAPMEIWVLMLIS